MDFISELLAAPFVCIGWIILGALAGGLAHSIMRSDAPLIVDIVVGLLGAFIGGIIVSALGINRPDGGLSGYLASFVVAVVGAIILIALSRLFTGRRAV